MSDFGAMLSRLTADGETFTITAPEEWAQGRTLFGGMTAALAHGSATRRFADLPPLRSAQLAFIAPASGALSFRPVLLRQGRSATIVGVDVGNADGIAARATFVFGAARESAVRHDHAPRMAVPPPDACEPFHRTARPLRGFLSRFEFRLAVGARLFEREKPPAFAVWARLRDGDGDDPVAALLAFADCLPGAAMVSVATVAPISTMTWSIDLHQPLPAHDGWRLISSASEVAADGYSLQAMAVYDSDGRPLATARQLVAIFA